MLFNILFNISLIHENSPFMEEQMPVKTSVCDGISHRHVWSNFSGVGGRVVCNSDVSSRYSPSSKFWGCCNNMFFPNNRSQWRVFHLWFGHYSNAKVMCGDRGSGGDWRITELKGATWLQKIFSKWGLKKKACFIQTREDMDMVWHGGWLKKVWSCNHLLLKTLLRILSHFFTM